MIVWCIYVLFKKNYDVLVELFVCKKMWLKKNNVYIVWLVEKMRMFLEDLKIVEEGFMFIYCILSELV